MKKKLGRQILCIVLAVQMLFSLGMTGWAAEVRNSTDMTASTEQGNWDGGEAVGAAQPFGKVDRTGFIGTASSERDAENGNLPAANALDGNETSFWHTSKYENGVGENPSCFPVHYVIDMTQATKVSELEIVGRSGSSLSSSGGFPVKFEVYASDAAPAGAPGTDEYKDLTGWEKIAAADWNRTFSSGMRETVEFSHTVEARYLRLVISDTLRSNQNEYFASAAELNLYYTDSMAALRTGIADAKALLEQMPDGTAKTALEAAIATAETFLTAGDPTDVDAQAAALAEAVEAARKELLTDTELTVAAPTEDLQIKVWLDEAGTPYYNVTFRGTQLIEPSKLGLVTKDIGSFDTGFTMGEAVQTSSDTTWNPIVGEQETIRDNYNQVSIPLTNASGTITIEVRAYDTGVAVRYILPAIPQGRDRYTIGSDGDKTQYAFPAGVYAYTHVGQNQTHPTKVSVDNLNSSYRPMTLLYPNGSAVTICEANLDNYSILKFEKDGSQPRTSKTRLGGDVVVRENAEAISEKDQKTMIPAGPFASSWRAFVVGESEAGLAQNSSLVQNLNEAPDEAAYNFSEWVEAGSCQRAMRGDNDDTNVMNNAYLEGFVDEAAARGHRYVLLDTGWQGPENDANCDPRLDPAKLDPENYPKDKILKEKYFAQPGEEQENSFLGNGEGCFYTRDTPFKKYGNLGEPGDMHVNIDIPKLCDYANKKGIGIILYVNGTRFFPDDMSGSGGRYRFTADELFEYFERWGVAGVKPGFVHCDDQKAEVYMQEVVKAAAKHHLVMTVHDRWVPSGIERTFPNLLSAEGILGDEEKSGVGIGGDISTLFTRTIQGPADHTYCWPGKATKAYALASPLMFRTGLNCLFWYTNTSDIPEKDKDLVTFYDNMPATWKKTLYLEGKMDGYATYARQSFPDAEKGLPSTWYIGSITAVDRTLNLPLDFLDAGRYVAEIYYDGPDADPNAGFNTPAKKEQTLLKSTFMVDGNTTLFYNLKAKYGYAVRLTRAEDFGDTTGIPGYELWALTNVLTAVNQLEEPSYEGYAWKNLQAEKGLAQNVYDDPGSTADDISAAVAALTGALDVYLATIPLQDALAFTDHLVENYYTEDSWNVLAGALAEGRRLLDQASAGDEIAAAAAALQAAIDGLVEDLFAQKTPAGYLSDLVYDAERSWCSNRDANDGNRYRIYTDENRVKDKLSLMIDATQTFFDKGMAIDAQGDLFYDLTGKNYEVFEAWVGVDAGQPTKGDIIFKVYDDGPTDSKDDDILLYTSNPSGNGMQNAQFVSVPINGVKKLRLETDMNGSMNGDWGDWADAKFYTIERGTGDAGSANVALNKPVSASSAETQNGAGNITDGNLNTRWSASSADYPQHAIIDLGAAYDILQFAPNFYEKNGDRAYKYHISVSTDGVTYVPCIDRSENTTPGQVKDRAPENTRGRYVKIDFIGVVGAGYAGLREFEVIGVVSATPEITAQPQAQEVAVGAAATFSVEASAPDQGTLTYQWQKLSADAGAAWTEIDGATGARYTTPAATLADQGTQLRCVVTNTKDALDPQSVTTVPASLNVKSSVYEVTIAAAPSTVQVGGDVNVTVTAKGGKFVGAACKLSFENDKFAVKSAPDGWEAIGENIYAYYNVINSGFYPEDTVLGDFVFTARDQRSETTGSFTLSDTYLAGEWEDGWSTDDAEQVPNNGSVDVKITLAPAYVVEIVDDYVAGYSLVLVYTDKETGAYAYDGEAMYDVTDAGYLYQGTKYTRVYGLVVSGKDATADKVASAEKSAGTLTYTTDVNGSNTTDINDAVAVVAVYNANGLYMTAIHMDIVLKADVNGNKKVNVDDFGLIKAEF